MSATPDTQKAFLIQEAGFTKITTIQEAYYKCSSCQGTYQDWKQNDDPWKIHAQHFSYCPHVIYSKSKFFIKESLKQNTHQPFQYTAYYRFLN